MSRAGAHRRWSCSCPRQAGADVAQHDPLYVSARTVLLDALEALGSQRRAIVVVGAQAVYLRTGDAGIAVAPYTTDADVALSPQLLADYPLIERVMTDADFRQESGPGEWLKTVDVDGQAVDVPVDIMVPTGFAPPGGRRGVRLPPHDKMAARKALASLFSPTGAAAAGLGLLWAVAHCGSFGSDGSLLLRGRGGDFSEGASQLGRRCAVLTML